MHFGVQVQRSISGYAPSGILLETSILFLLANRRLVDYPFILVYTATEFHQDSNVVMDDMDVFMQVEKADPDHQ